MLPAPMSWTARGEAVTAATGAGGARGVAGGGDVADGIWSSLHVASSSRATGRATATSLARRDVIVPSADLTARVMCVPGGQSCCRADTTSRGRGRDGAFRFPNGGELPA